MKIPLKNPRAFEIFLMPGFVLAALPFAGEIPTHRLIVTGVPLFFASLLLVVSVYATNRYFGFTADRLNARLRPLQPAARKYHALAAAVTLVASLFLFAQIGPALPYLAGLSFLLWAAYSVPGGAKARPVWGTAIHLVSQIVQFHIGIVAFADASPRTVLISIFFALMFSSGHLMHEIKDWECDRAAGIRTNAVVFGQGRMIAFYKRALFVLPLYWAALYALGVINTRLFLPLFVAIGSHVLLSWFWDEKALEKNEPFQKIYRALYLLAGLATFGATRL